MIWYVAVGSALGGITRYLAGGGIQRLFGTAFPIGTLTVNVTGSLLVGFLMRYTVATPDG